MDQYIGKMLDNRYEILDVVGSGGMAVVYKARCHRLNRLVAVKILKDELAQDAELRRRFHDESQAVAMLSHPNIVAVYDVSKSDNVEYIVMELIDGITLKQYMQQRGGILPWREALHFITQIVKALGHAHSRGIIHRDIKPHNIMVLRDGSVKVADFGIARFTASQNTLTQEALGSVHYISPEQARGSHIDARSDLYSAGVVLYEMLTGRLPYEGDSPVAVAIQHINSIPLSPRELNPDIPEALEKITMKAMASDPAKRYPSSDTMLADLEEFRKNPNINFDYTMETLHTNAGEDEPTQVVPASRITSSLEGASDRMRHQMDEEEDDEEDHGSGKGFYIAAIAAVLIFVLGVSYFLYTNFLSDLFRQPESILVPNVLGVDWDALRDRGPEYEAYWEDVSFVLGGSVYSDSYETGKIVSQDPKEGTAVAAEGTVITVYVSAGPSSGKMLDVIGKSPQEARLMLEDLLDSYDLKVKTISEYNDTVEKGMVCRTDPQKDFDLQKGDTITLYISLGADVQQVAVPDFTVGNRESAETTAASLNLKLEYLPDMPDERPAGSIIYQSVNSGTMVDEGTVIKLRASSGPTVTEPPVETTPGGLKYWSTTVALPAAQDGETEAATITVTVDGTETENTQQLRGTTFTLEIAGQGIQEVVIYVDGAVYSRTPVNFDTEGVSRE